MNFRGLLLVAVGAACLAGSPMAFAARPDLPVGVGDGPSPSDPVTQEEAALDTVAFAAIDQLVDIENAAQAAIHVAADNGASYAEMRKIATSAQKALKKAGTSAVKQLKSVYKSNRKAMERAGASASELTALDSYYFNKLGDIDVEVADCVHDVFTTLESVANDL